MSLSGSKRKGLIRSYHRANLFSLRSTILFLSLVALVIGSCIEILTVNQPASVMVNEEFTITLDVEITGKDGGIAVVGFLAPRSWNAAENTTMSYTSDFGNSSFSLMPEDEVDVELGEPWVDLLTERGGIGQNYGEVEWVVFKADQENTPPGSTSESNPVYGTLTINTVAGECNLRTQLAYFIGEAIWGYVDDANPNFTYFFPEECIEVTGGDGPVKDLCGPPPRRLVTLEEYTFEDIITIEFDAKEDTSALIGANKVFFCSRAVYDGGTNEVCEISDKTEMIPVGDDKWQITLWAPGYYETPQGEEILELYCNFTDESGSVVVQDPSGVDFRIVTKCGGCS